MTNFQFFFKDFWLWDPVFELIKQSRLSTSRILEGPVMPNLMQIAQESSRDG